MVLSEQDFFQSNVKKLGVAGVENPYFEVQLLMALAVKVDRVKIIAGIGRAFTDLEIETFLSYVNRRCKREPLAYIRGTQEFYGLEFKVSNATLVPRPETELLVDFAVKTFGKSQNCNIVDVGTGTGCIAIAIASKLPDAKILAVDKSSEAAKVALTNANLLTESNQVLIVQSDLLSAISSNSIDLVLSNPPYIPTKELRDLQPEVSLFEPKIALDGGKDGFEFHKRLIVESKRVLNPGGWLGIEVALGQSAGLQRMFDKAEYVNTRRIKDLSGIDRVVVGQLDSSG